MSDGFNMMESSRIAFDSQRSAGGAIATGASGGNSKFVEGFDEATKKIFSEPGGLAKFAFPNIFLNVSGFSLQGAALSSVLGFEKLSPTPGSGTINFTRIMQQGRS